MDTIQDQATTLRATLTLDVTYLLNGASPEVVLENLRQLCDRAIGEGMLTGYSEAEVDEYTVNVTAYQADLDEDQLTGFFADRIETGDIALEDIPSRMARYGLMGPAAFVNEMAERMELAAATDVAESATTAKTMRIFGFGQAPAAGAEGYKMNGTLHSTVEDLTATYGSQDLIFVYGASVFGQEGVFEFARFEPINP